MGKVIRRKGTRQFSVVWLLKLDWELKLQVGYCFIRIKRLTFLELYIFYRGKRLGVLYPLLYSPSRWRAMLTISFLNDGLAFLKTLKTKCIYLYQQLLASFIKNVWVFMDMIFGFNIRMIPWLKKTNLKIIRLNEIFFFQYVIVYSFNRKCTNLYWI